METILGWVNLAAAALLAVGCLMLFVDGRGKRKAWNGVLGRIAAVELQAVEYGRRLTTLEHSFESVSRQLAPPPSPSPVSLRLLSPPAADRVIPARLDALGTAVAELGRRMTALEAIVRPPPPVDTEGDREGSPPASRQRPSPSAEDEEPEETQVLDGKAARRLVEINGIWRALPVQARSDLSRTLVSPGQSRSAGPRSEPKAIPVEQVAKLTPAMLARVDAMAAKHGLTREAMLAKLAELGVADIEENGPGPTALGAPANDAGEEDERETLSPPPDRRR